MNTLFPFPGRRLARLLMLVLAGYMSVSPVARAGLTVDIHLYHDELGYYFYSYLSADATLPAFPNGVYQIASPTVPLAARSSFSTPRMARSASVTTAIAVAVPITARLTRR